MHGRTCREFALKHVFHLLIPLEIVLFELGTLLVLQEQFIPSNGIQTHFDAAAGAVHQKIERDVVGAQRLVQVLGLRCAERDLGALGHLRGHFFPLSAALAEAYTRSVVCGPAYNARAYRPSG